MLNQYIVVGLYLSDRFKHALEVQKILTEYGCNIKTRIGLHEVSETFCATCGLVILELIGDQGKINECIAKLQKIAGLEVQKMIFNKQK
jgi:hypothetical protein